VPGSGTGVQTAYTTSVREAVSVATRNDVGGGITLSGPEPALLSARRPLSKLVCRRTACPSSLELRDSAWGHSGRSTFQCAGRDALDTLRAGRFRITHHRSRRIWRHPAIDQHGWKREQKAKGSV